MVDHGRVTPAIARGLRTIKKRLADVPSSRLDETMTLATWNIRELGKKRRTDAAIHYIAEVLCHFDLIGVVELRDNLEDFERVRRLLGPNWKAVMSDVIPDAAGNGERTAYLYDSRVVEHTGLAAEATAPRTKTAAGYQSRLTWWRAPYIASFRAGSFDFVVITAHIRWSEVKGREQELALLSDWVKARWSEPTVEDKDLFVIGDFNIPSRASKLWSALTKGGLVLPTALRTDTFGSDLRTCAARSATTKSCTCRSTTTRSATAAASPTSTPATTARCFSGWRSRRSRSRCRTTCRCGCR